MKYFLAIDLSGKRHVVVAESIEQAKVLFTNKLKTIYELTSDTFKTAGFVISDK